MENNFLLQIKELVTSELRNENAKIILFGSRARKKNNSFSDVDIGIIPKGKVNNDKITLLREKIENLNIPYKVEIVDFSDVSEDFKKEALKEAIIWKD